MNETYVNGDAGKVGGYHAHVYYDADSRETAARLRQRVWRKWPDAVVMGRFRDRPVGPHPACMYQVTFDRETFAEIVPWLMHNRDGLTILVHPEGEDAHDDHAHYPLWLGGRLDLDLAFLAAGNRQA